MTTDEAAYRAEHAEVARSVTRLSDVHQKPAEKRSILNVEVDVTIKPVPATA